MEIAMSATNDRSNEDKITIVYTTNNRFDKQAKKRIRAHAAAWSRAHGTKRVPKRSRELVAVPLKSPKIFADSALPRRTKKEEVEASPESLTAQIARAAASATLAGTLFLGCRFDEFRALPQLPLEDARPDALSVAKSHMSIVLGEEFIRRNVPLSGTQSTAMYVGSLLISYARHYALTGKLLGPDLLVLKGEVIQIINHSFQKAKSFIDLESLFAIFVLGTPVVCLTTMQLPSSNTARKSLFAAQQATSTTAVADSLVSELALRDHLLHRQTVIRILLEMGPSRLRQHRIGRHFMAFFILLGNLASLISAIQPVFDESDLYPSPVPRCDVKTSPIWHSPLYCPAGAYVGAKAPRNSTEALTAELCRSVQSWLGTFEGDGDGSGHESMLAYRQYCRQVTELFKPYTGSSVSESGSVYECCRLVAHVMLRAEALRCSVREAAEGTAYLVDIDNALQRTNLFNLWDSQIGLLYWVLLVSCTSALGSSFSLSPTTVLLNFLVGKIATSDYHVQVGLRPLQKLKRFNQICHNKIGRPPE